MSSQEQVGHVSGNQENHSVTSQASNGHTPDPRDRLPTALKDELKRLERLLTVDTALLKKITH